METRVETWPGLCPGKLRACIWMSVLRCLGLGLRWASLGNRALLWVEFHGPPGGQCCGRACSLSAASSPSWGSWRPLRWLSGNHSNFPAHSGWVGRQVHLVNWFQGTGILQKVNGQQVRLLLWSPFSRLSPPKRTELLRVSQPSSPVFSAPQRDKKDRACQNQGSVFTSSMSFQTSKNHTEPQWKQKGPDFSGTIEGRGDWP